MLLCLNEKLNQGKLVDAVCTNWLNDRAICVREAEASGKCTLKDTPRRCLSKMKPHELTDMCTSTSFWKAIQLYSIQERRRRQRPVGEQKERAQQFYLDGKNGKPPVGDYVQ